MNKAKCIKNSDGNLQQAILIAAAHRAVLQNMLWSQQTFALIVP